LLLVEVQNAQGKSSFEALNAVRTRGGLLAPTESSQAALQIVIEHKRRVELAFENHSWSDLQRTGRAIEVINAFVTKLKQQVNYLPTDIYQVTQNRLLYPIPESEREGKLESQKRGKSSFPKSRSSSSSTGVV
jgi:hypothetical protein